MSASFFRPKGHFLFIKPIEATRAVDVDVRRLSEAVGLVDVV
jgi:hypothetical protein